METTGWRQYLGSIAKQILSYLKSSGNKVTYLIWIKYNCIINWRWSLPHYTIVTTHCYEIVKVILNRNLTLTNSYRGHANRQLLDLKWVHCIYISIEQDGKSFQTFGNVCEIQQLQAGGVTLYYRQLLLIVTWMFYNHKGLLRVATFNIIICRPQTSLVQLFFFHKRFSFFMPFFCSSTSDTTTIWC